MQSWSEKPENDDLAARLEWEKKHGLIITNRGWAFAVLLGILVIVGFMSIIGAVEV